MSNPPLDEAPPPDIQGGIEWPPYGLDEPTCARCGGAAEYLRCSRCGGEGMTHHDCGEDTCCCLHPEDNVDCDYCGGEGGSTHCANTPEWCEANPLPNRAHIPSTALRAEAWTE